MIQTSPLFRGTYVLFAGMLMLLTASCIGGKKDTPVVAETEEEEAAKPFFEGICDLNGEPVEGEAKIYDPQAA